MSSREKRRMWLSQRLQAGRRLRGMGEGLAHDAALFLTPRPPLLAAKGKGAGQERGVLGRGVRMRAGAGGCCKTSCAWCGRAGGFSIATACGDKGPAVDATQRA